VEWNDTHLSVDKHDSALDVFYLGGGVIRGRQEEPLNSKLTEAFAADFDLPLFNKRNDTPEAMRFSLQLREIFE
jgi:hypothetical protein